MLHNAGISGLFAFKFERLWLSCHGGCVSVDLMFNYGD
jgi:hypothetical protein